VIIGDKRRAGKNRHSMRSKNGQRDYPRQKIVEAKTTEEKIGSNTTKGRTVGNKGATKVRLVI